MEGLDALTDRNALGTEALLDAAPDAILGVDAEGRIALANTQAVELFGYRRDELVGQPVEILVPDSHRARHPDQRRKYLGDPHPRPMGAGSQLVARRKDGSEFPADISLSSLHEAGGELLVLAAVRDVTGRVEAEAERGRLRAEAERERLERRLQQSQRLESLGQLAGGVAHDFNNLLAVIMNYASFLSDDLASGEDLTAKRREELHHDANEIERAAERAAVLIRQLLTFARRDVVRPVVLDVNDVVSDMDTLLRRTLGEHIEMVCSLAPGLWPVQIDAGHLEQVLVNLAVNARDAMPGGGTLSIDTSNVDHEGNGPTPDAGPGRAVRVTVSDTGTGMPRHVAARVFEPFFTTKAPGAGSGLGLATVYGIVAQAGGTLEIESEEGVGTTVSVVLPAAAAAAEPDTPEQGPTLGGRETVLVVEDEDALRSVALRILGRSGYNVLVASGGTEAIELVQSHEGAVDLLLTDVVMPEMLGRELASRITAISPGTRVVFMSSYARPVLASQGTLEPGVALVEKPFTAPVLLECVRAALDRPPSAGVG